MSTETETAAITNRKVITDSNGNLWDLGNPQIIAILNNGANGTVLQFASASQAAPIAFSAASAAFNAS